ncbi:MAG TPA: hypothetical protein VGU90_07900 [Terriglobales bacterium]|nr:hypothetical protein [Terriglobales bacterium]
MIPATETPLQHNDYLMTRTQAHGYSRVVVSGLQQANAFVIQFRGAGGADAERFSGRVEHVASGRTATFQTVQELPRILLKMLDSVTSDEGNGIG